MKYWQEKKSIYRNILSYKGLGEKRAGQVCASLGISQKSKKSELSHKKWEDLNKLLTEIQKQKQSGTYQWEKSNPLTAVEGSQGRKNKNESYPLIGENLNLEEKRNFQRRISIKSVKAIRLKQGYPVRGQRTRSNARTSRQLNRRRY